MPDSPLLAELIARASDPAERLQRRWVYSRAHATGQARVNRWQQSLAANEGEHVHAALQARGIKLHDWQLALGTPALTSSGQSELINAQAGLPTQLPAWVQDACLLIRLLEQPPAPGTLPSGFAIHTPTLAEIAGAQLPDFVDGTSPWRFYQGFAAWHHHAITTLISHLEALSAQQLQILIAPLSRNLLQRFLQLCGPLLMRQAPHPDQTFFHHDLRWQGWARLWQQAPVLLRLFAISYRQWQVASTEILTRIHCDSTELAPGTAVSNVSLSAGDQHDHGRSVTAVDFNDGSRWFLKPRNSDLFPLLSSMFSGIDPDCSLGLTLPQSLGEADYEWAKQVTSEPVDSREQLSPWWYRAGALAQVMHLMGATDLHQENLIATAAGPVVIDLETLLGPQVEQATDLDAVATAMGQSVSATSQLSSPVDGPPGSISLDIGAYAGPVTNLTPYQVQSVALVNGTPEVQSSRLPYHNGLALPRFDDAVVGVTGYTNDLLAGFTHAACQVRTWQASEDFARWRAELLTSKAEVRFVPRPTQVYTRLLQQSLQPAALADGAERALVLDRLWRASQSTSAALITAEIAALNRLDVPFFTCAVNGTELMDESGQTLAGTSVQSPAQVLLARLHALLEPWAADRAEQQVKATLFALTAASEQPHSPIRGQGDTESYLHLCHQGQAYSRPSRTDSTPSHKEAERLSAPWLGLDFDASRQRFRYGKISGGLLGLAGIGLTLIAAAAHEVPTDTPSAVACRNLGVDTLLQAAASWRDFRPQWHSADAFSGPGGCWWALVKAWSENDWHLSHDQLEKLAAAIVTLHPITQTAAQHGHQGDVVTGATALAIGLAAIEQASRPGSATCHHQVSDLAATEGDWLVDYVAACTPDRPLPRIGDAASTPWLQHLPSAKAGQLRSLVALQHHNQVGHLARALMTRWPTAAPAGSRSADRYLKNWVRQHQGTHLRAAPMPEAMIQDTPQLLANSQLLIPVFGAASYLENQLSPSINIRLLA